MTDYPENAALQAAIDEYMAADKAWTTHILAASSTPLVEPLGLSDAEALFKRHRAAREAYAKELEAVGYAVPHGLLDY